MHSLLLEIDPPKITDWIQAGGAVIGAVGAIAAFIALFKKDKEKEKMIQTLADLVIKQDDIIDQMNRQLLEFAQQTHELKSQTLIASTSNKLLSDQVNVLSEHFGFTKEITTSRIDQQSKDRKKSLLPRFRRNGAQFNREAQRIMVMLINDGNIATRIRAQHHSDFISVRLNSEDVVYSDQVKTNENLNLIVDYLSSKGRDFDSDFDITLSFLDADGNGYNQSVFYQRGQFNTTDPVPAPSSNK